MDDYQDTDLHLRLHLDTTLVTMIWEDSGLPEEVYCCLGCCVIKTTSCVSDHLNGSELLTAAAAGSPTLILHLSAEGRHTLTSKVKLVNAGTLKSLPLFTGTE